MDHLRQQLKLSEEKILQLEEMISQLRKQLAAPKGGDGGKLGAFGSLFGFIWVDFGRFLSRESELQMAAASVWGRERLILASRPSGASKSLSRSSWRCEEWRKALEKRGKIKENSI